MKRNAILGLIAAVALASAPAFARSSGEIVGMGDLPGGGFNSAAMAVSDDGAVVTGYGDSGLEPNSVSRTVIRWTRATGIVVPSGIDPRSYNSQGDALSGDGQVIAGVLQYEDFSGAAFTQSEPLGANILPSKPPASAWSVVALSHDGAIFIGNTRPEGEGENIYHAYRSTPDEGLRLLFDGVDQESQACALSDDGSVVFGSVTFEDGIAQMFRWSASGSVHLASPYPGFANFVPTDTSADGAVTVGNCVSSEVPLIVRPFQWTEHNGLELLPVPEMTMAVALGVSGDGTIIVGHTLDRYYRIDLPVIWLGGKGPLPLADYLTQSGVIGADQWSLIEVSGISSDGHTIVGVGTNSHEGWQGFIATIPPRCAGDANRDETVDVGDVGAVLANWSGFGPQGDANDDFSVDFDDITEVLAHWQAECP